MSKLFEATWRDNYEYFERYFDTVLNKSVKKQIAVPHEWFEPSSNGKYSYILDDTVKLEKCQGKRPKGGYGVTDPMYRNIRDNYWKNASYNKTPRTWYLDIETRVGQNSTGFPVPEKALESISLMQFYDSELKTMFVIGMRDWVHQDSYSFDYTVKYIKCNDEIHLLETYLTLFEKLNPLIIYAWNGNGFDFPYIYNRLKRLGIDTNRLSNYGSMKITDTEYQGRISFKVVCNGHFYIDLMNVYKKFTFKPVPSYALDVVAELELKEKKVVHSEYAAFDDFYSGKYIIPKKPTDAQKNSRIYKEAINGNWEEVKELAHSEFVYYGVIDTHLILRIDEKKNFTVLQSMISEKMGVTIGDAMGTVKPWSRFLSNTSMEKLQVMPPRQDFDQPSIVGGYVREPETGKHDWVLSADVNSMYPLLGMVGFNMSPETYIKKGDLPPQLRDIVLSYFNDQEESKRLELEDNVWNNVKSLLREHDLCLGINGAVFDRSEVGMVPKLVRDIYKTRKKAKGTQFEYEQRKIMIQEILNKRSV